MQSTPVALPLLQGLVTILVLSSTPFAEADVSHVLRGEARPPPHRAATDPREVNSLTADAGDYWWMADDSPFRAAYDEYKKCSEKGNCLNGGGKAFAAGGSVGVSANANLPPIDIKKNPFLNGAIQSNSLAHGQGSKVEGGGHAFHSGASIDISKNPFFNGEFVAGNGDKIHDENGFIGVQPKKPGFATSHPLASNKPGFSTSFPVGQQAIVLNGSSSAFGSGSSGFGAGASFAIARGQTHQGGLQHSEHGPSQPDFGQAARSGSVACTVKNHACVPKHLCVNGVVNGNTENLLSGSYCNPESEVCCQLSGQRNSENTYNQLPNLSQKTAHPTSINDLISSEKKPSSGSSIKFAGANGSSPITIQVIGGENDDGKTQYTSGSSIQPSTLKPTREVNSNENSIFGSPVDYSNVHFDSNVRFASTIQGPEYLPPLEGTTPSISTYQPSIPTTPRPVSCPPGTQRTLGGLCESTQLPECPPGTIRKPDNSCAKPACPYGYEQQPDGSCKRLQPPTTPQTPTTPSCPPGTYSIGGGRCSSPSSPVSSCPPGTLRRPDGSCGPRTGPTPTPCPPGTHLTSLGECAPDTQKSVCPFGAVRLPDGTCQTTSSPRPCPPGTFLTASGSCAPSSTPTTPAPSCPPGTIQQPDGSCQRRITPLPTCPPGTFRGPSGECRTQPTPLPGCPIGSTRQPDGSCQRTCPPGLHPQPNGECRGPSTPSPTSRCPAGTIQQPDGSCHRPSSPSPSCPPGSYPGPNGECRGPSTPSPTSRCPAGTIRQPDGSCQRPSSPSPSCPPGSYPGPNGECRGPSTPSPTSRCPAGTIQQPDGSCQRPSSPSPSCPPGSYPGHNGECRGPSTPSPTSRCPAGTIQQPDGSCQRLSSPSPSCPPGSYPGPNGECRGPPTPSPTPRCPAGTIQQPDGSCQRPSSPSPSCPPGSYPGPNGECRGPSTPSPTPRCPAGTVQQPDGSCQRPQLPCPPGTYQGYNGECKRRTTPAPRCPIGTTQQPDGSCQKPVTPGPVCPAGTSQQPDGSCQRPISPTSCPPNTYLGSSGSCEPVRAVTTTGPPAYEYPRPCPPGTVKSATGTCEALPSSPRPACPTGTRSTPFGTCEPIFSATTPKPPPRPFERPTTPELNKDYLPPKPTSQPSGGYNYETPTPTFGYPSSPLDSSQNNIYGQYASTTSTPRYTPQKPGPSEGPDNTVDSANANSFFVPTTRQPVTAPQPTYSRQPTFNGGQQPIEETSPPVGCAAALKCVQEIYCTADGFVSPVPVVLTKEQETLRVPTTTCKDIETGIIGKCCRDPNYKDPWPSANLVNGVDDGQYKEDNFYGQRELTSNRLTRASNLTGSPVIPPALRRSRTQEASSANCGTRNLDSSPKGESPLDANFAEYPWQAMILRDSNRSLLCGGVIIRDNAILTSAHCVEGLDTNDVLAKGGEWKLGIDEEPLPFQIVKVGAIIRHPEYKPGSYHNDVAILVLREKLRFTKNIGPLCLLQTKEISPNSKCKLTGWGKRILQLHARGAIMHHIDVNVVDNQKCQQQLSERFKESLPNYSPNMLCGQSNIDHCKVDYGSALACENDQGQYEFAGIYTWDTGCNQEGQIAGFVKPDTAWIQTTLRKPVKELKRIEREYLRSH